MRAVLRGAILRAQFALRADVLRAFARLGTDRRDGELRERCKPREDLRLNRAMGGRAQEVRDYLGWSHDIALWSLVNLKLYG
jgi:hypothetical protein